MRNNAKNEYSCDLCGTNLWERPVSSILKQKSYIKEYWWNDKIFCKKCTVKIFTMIESMYETNMIFKNSKVEED